MFHVPDDTCTLALMAYDEALAERVRYALDDTPRVEKKMFGGLAFMVGGHMACGVVGEELMIRLGNDGIDAALAEPHVRPMDFTGRTIRSMAFVDAEGIAADEDLARWVERVVTFAESLPPK